MDQQDPFKSRSTTLPPNENTEDVVEGVADEQALVPAPYYNEAKAPPTRRPRRRTRPLEVPRFSLFVISISLIIAGVFFTLLNVADLPQNVQDWWPAVSLGAATVWALGALIRRNATAFVAGAAIAGLSVSFLLETQEIATVEETVFGVILMMLGLSVVIRGLLIRPRVAQ